MSHLYIFQLGPVQSFIASARRTQDLVVGSRMLSALAEAGVWAAYKAPGYQSIFPVIDENTEKLQGAPHRFAFIADDDPATVAESVWQAVNAERQTRFVQPVQDWLLTKIEPGYWQEVYTRQTDSWLEFNWIAVDYNPNDHIGSYQQATKLLAARRASRDFVQVEEEDWKCTLTGAGSALPLAGAGASRRELMDAWGRLQKQVGEIVLRDGEMLSAMAVIKRFAGQDFANCGLDVDRFPSTDDIAGVKPEDQRSGKEVTGYLAVLHMDGDKMGERVSQCTTLEEHRAFSQSLMAFANDDVPKIIKDYKRAALVYAGGDDVLALLPLRDALAVAEELRQAFKERVGDVTASAGIAVTPYNLPLDNALQMSREAEHTAKEGYGRNAVVVTEAHGTGQVRQAGAHWVLDNGGTIAVLVNTLIEYFTAKEVSARIGYDIQRLAYEMPTSNTALAAAREAELTRLLRRRIAESVSKERAQAIVADLRPQLIAWGNDPQCGWESLANWVIMARFLASEGAAS